MSLPSTERMIAKVRKFVPDPILLISPDEVEAKMGVPDAWVQMLRQQNEGIKSWLAPWGPYRNLLPGVYNFLERQVRGVCLLLEEQQPPSLIYVYSRGDTDYFYRGRPPAGDRMPGDSPVAWGQFPLKLQEFYSQLHDGWTQLSSDALGPLPVKDIGYLSDQDWDLEPEDFSNLPFRLDEVITVFNNGAGDYIGLDLRQGDGAVADHALVWWHEDPLKPDIDQNFWALLDAWISGQMEDVDINR